MHYLNWPSLFKLISFNKWKLRSSLLGEDHYCFIDEAMTADNELTSRQLFSHFTARNPKIQISMSTVKQVLRHLGWISKKTRYCALIWEANKGKRLLWCQEQVEQNDRTSNWVMWCSVMKALFNLRAIERHATTFTQCCQFCLLHWR